MPLAARATLSFSPSGPALGLASLLTAAFSGGRIDIAGAIGWMALDRPYRPEYQRCGCFESHASGVGIEQTARTLLTRERGHRGPLADIPADQITTAQVLSAAEAGDPIARRVLDQAIECWGMAIANLVSLFNPEVVLLGGGLFGPAGRYLDRIAAEVRKWAQPVSITQVAIRLAQLGPDACLLGTSLIAHRVFREVRSNG